MVRRAYARYVDIQDACRAIQRYVAADIDAGVKFDAIRMRMVEIGEAVKGLSEAERAKTPEIPWNMISGMRDHIAHRYWDTAHTIVMNAARSEIPLLLDAVNRVIEIES